MKDSDQVLLAQATKAAREAQQSVSWREFIATVATEKFAKFQAYRSAGFNAKEALELVIREQQP